MGSRWFAFYGQETGGLMATTGTYKRIVSETLLWRRLYGRWVIRTIVIYEDGTRKVF